jgi:hypothetical protein
MMSDQPSSSFEDTPTSVDTPVAPAIVPPTAPVVPTIASEFVGEGKKYSSIEVALGAIPHAQQHIENLEAENARLRAAEANADKDQIATPATPELDQNKMREEARHVYQQISAEQVRSSNIATADNAMLEKYGDKRGEVTASVAAELGVSVKFLEEAAAKSPKAFLKLVSDSSSNQSGMPHIETSTINSGAINLGQQPEAPSVNVGGSGSAKDLVQGWRAAGKKVSENQ